MLSLRSPQVSIMASNEPVRQIDSLVFLAFRKGSPLVSGVISNVPVMRKTFLCHNAIVGYTVLGISARHQACNNLVFRNEESDQARMMA